MAEYSPDVLQDYADRLYARATLAIIVYVLLAAFIGAAFSLSVTTSHIFRIDEDSIWLGSILVCSSIGLVLGYFRSLHYKIQAQQILCQVEIERNTRLTAERSEFLIAATAAGGK